MLYIFDKIRSMKFFLHSLLSLIGHSPQVLTGLLGLSGVVSDHTVVEDGAALDLSQVETHLEELVVLGEILSLVGIKLRVVDLGVDLS